MLRPLDLAIVFAPVGGGHRAAALALAEAARGRGLTTEVIDLFEHGGRVFGDAYKTVHVAWQTAAPELYGSAYFAANHRGGAFEPVRQTLDHLVFHDLENAIARRNPRAVVGTHHLPLVVLGAARRRGVLRRPLVGVVTDYGVHACWAEPGVDAFCVAGEPARRDLLRHRIAAERLHVTGIPIRDGFASTAPLVPPRAGEPLRVLVTSGGFGVGPLRAIVRSFAGIPDVALTVVCGAVGPRVDRVRRAAMGAGVDAEVVGFETDMPKRVAGAQLVVGKAGGLTVTESLAAGRPMITVGTVPGNETFNERLVVQGGAGFAAQAKDVGPLAALLRAQGRLHRMSRRARGLVLPDAGDRVLDVVSALAFATERSAA